jgi:membrane-associated HD superfamily phosphohydrolase
MIDYPKTKEELQQRGTNFLIKYWYIFVILIMFSFSIFMFQLNNQNKKEIDELKAKISLTENIQQTEARLTEMKQREAELYPVLNKKYAELEFVKTQIEKKRSELKEVDKERIKNEIEKMDLRSINNLFNELGYTNTIVSK